MLAFLLFAGAIQLNLDDLGREWLTISLLAVLGTLISTCIVGGVTWLVLGWLGLGIPFLHALLFGALISPTDPIAVLGIMKSVGASRQLEVQVAGESLFNDGLGVVIFLVLLQLSGLDGAAGSVATASLSIDVGGVGMLLLKEVVGALVLALAAGIVTYQMLKRVDNYQVEVLLTLALAMGLYALADALHLSAPIAVVGSWAIHRQPGASIRHDGEDAVNTSTRSGSLSTRFSTSFLFLLIGLELLVLPIEHGWLVAGVLAIPIVLTARLLSVAGIIGPLGMVTAQSKGAIPVLTWGGLRGGISLAMALSLPANDSRSLVLTLTYFVVVFSILVQGLTVGRLIRTTCGSTAAPQASSRL